MADVPWNYLVGNQTLGPVTVEQMRELFRSNAVTPDTLVWTPGFSEWMALRHTDLFQVCTTEDVTPPPPPEDDEEKEPEDPPQPPQSAQPTPPPQPASQAVPVKSHTAVHVLVSLVGYAVGYFCVAYFSPQTSAEILEGAAAGLALGLPPYFIARHRGHPRLGRIALRSCIFAGLILGIILALPVAIVFSIIAAVSRKPGAVTI